MRLFRQNSAVFPARATSLLLAALTSAMAASPAWAVQTHGGAEGYLVHQMGHLFLGAALLFLISLLHRRPPGKGRPWRQLKISLFLFFLWDVDTTTVHWLAERLPDNAVISGTTLAADRILLPDTWPWLLYYFGSLDHLLCVPAAWFLLLSLKGLATEITRRQSPISSATDTTR